jgi:hypothetical protein
MSHPFDRRHASPKIASFVKKQHGGSLLNDSHKKPEAAAFAATTMSTLDAKDAPLRPHFL